MSANGKTRLSPEQLRSFRWFGPNDLRTFGQRSRLRQMGLGPEDWVGKPVIAILNTWSEINPCHLHFKVLAENVKKGVLQAGGMPIEIPVLSLAENFMKPTTMLYRNLLAMETEEVLRSHPVDGAVLLGACDKTTPALIMGALSAALPFIFVPGGPMLRGQWRGQTPGTPPTVTAIPEPLGLSLPGSSSIPASDARHWRMAADSGRQIVADVWSDM